MENSYIRIYWLLGFIVTLITALIVLPRILKNPIKQKKVKETFLMLFIILFITEIESTAFHLLIERDTLSLLFPLPIFIGLVYGNFEFFIMKKRLHQNTVKNTFFIPSYVFVVIISFVLPIVFLPFLHIFDFQILRWRILHFTLSFLLGYSAILYWRFLLLERKIGAIYFDKRILGFLKSKKENKKD